MNSEVVQEAAIEFLAENLEEIHVEEICRNSKFDQCEYTNSTGRGLSQHTIIFFNHLNLYLYLFSPKGALWLLLNIYAPVDQW